MDYLLICFVAFGASALTFFSGFGLGTILMPVFAIFFPLELAIGLTAIVHFLNNIFKFFLVGRFIERKVAFKFGIPAVLSAYFGAVLLLYLSKTENIITYKLFNTELTTSTINIIIAVLILIFSLFDLVPRLKKISFGDSSSAKYLYAGGFLSGFFGGLSGHQGAFRSIFLIKLDLTKQQFIATGIAVAIMIDTTRLIVYSEQLSSLSNVNFLLPLCAAIMAFLGALLGNFLVKKITYDFIRNILGFLLILIAIGLGLGAI